MQDLERKIGQLLLVGFEGRELPAEVASWLADGLVGGVILFTRNVASMDQVAELNASILAAGRDQPPPFIAVDQEGGRVARLREPFTQFGPFAELGATGSTTLAQRAGRALGLELASLGFNVNFAPVLDVDTNPQNPVIGDRALSADPEIVGRLGNAFAEGLRGAGVIACGKHFPGHGDTSLDSHHALPWVTHAEDRLWQIELAPFAAAIEGGIAALMSAHVVYSAWDAKEPATLSRFILQGVLRQELGFRGVVFSDDLEMAAVARRYPPGELAVRALEAGVDVILFCRQTALAREAARALADAVRQGRLPAARINEAASRVAELKSTVPADRPPRPRVGLPEHRELIEEIARARR